MPSTLPSPDADAPAERDPRGDTGEQARVTCLDRPYVLAITETIEAKLFARHEEHALIERFAARLRGGDVVYDIGAHAGYHALAFATRLDEGGCVFAFEANPHCHALLTANAGLNPSLRVEPRHLAVTDAPGEITLRHGAAYAASARLRDAHGDSRTRVAATSVDAFAETHPPPDAVKIDVEGAEDLVFAGMPRTLGDPRLRAILLELHPQWLAEGPDAADALRAELAAHGFVETYRETRRQQMHLLLERG